MPALSSEARPLERNPECAILAGDFVQFHAGANTGEARSSMSAASGMVLIGAHDNGEFEARSARTGALAWRTRLPNWVHSEAVVSRGEAVVGFGSAADLYAGNYASEPTSPNGIAAFSLADGRRLWQHFSRGAVMASPVIVGSLAIFGTGFNEATALRLKTGAVVWSDTLPGGVVMGSPATAGGFVYFALEPNHVCKLRAATGKVVWCRDLGPRYIFTGHSAPAVADGVVYLSAVDRPQVLLDPVARIVPDLVAYLRERLHGQRRADLSRQRGQTLLALSDNDGSTLWQARFGGTKPFVGHPAGAPVITPFAIAIVWPTSQTVAMVDRSTGSVLWRVATASAARGPLTAFDDRLILATPEGDVRILDERTGRTLCSYRMPAGSDRAGPTIYESTAYFALLNGSLIARPVQRVLHCKQ